MAWNPNPKVADARDIARKWGKQQVIILALGTNAAGDPTLEYASFGQTKTLCDEAKELAEIAYDSIYRHYDLKTF